MPIRFLRRYPVKAGSTVLLRVDWNVPIGSSGRVDRTEDFKIRKTLSTIEWLLKKKARVLLATHLGRPEGKPDPRFVLHPVRARVEQLLKKRILTIANITKKDIGDVLLQYPKQQLFLLQNLRFWKEEESNDRGFAKALGSCADLYVNDAFAVSHRAHASVAAITRVLPSVAGLLLEDELKNLDFAVKKAKHPYLFLLGGAKIEGKAELVKRFCAIADTVGVGGGIANTTLGCQGFDVGKSLSEHSNKHYCATLKHNGLVIPQDVVVGSDLHAKETMTIAIDHVRPNEVIGDIGPKSVGMLLPLIQKAKTVVWNGPLGFTENPAFAKASKKVAQAIAKSSAYSLAGGGETVSMLIKFGVAEKFSFVSTGGGAMIEYLEGRKLPGIEALKK